MIDLFSIERTECKNKKILWTEEQKEYIKKEYMGGKNLSQLGREFNIHYANIDNQLKRMGVQTRGYQEQSNYMRKKFPRNSNYFDKSQFDEKRAYWLGFLYADGCVHTQKGNRKEVSISLKDKEHLEKFGAALETSNKISVSKTEVKFKEPTTTYHFCLIDDKIWDDLVNLGCVPRKTYVMDKLPVLKKEHMSHFLRGFFDGDGSLHYKYNTIVTGEKRPCARVSFTGTWGFIEAIKDFLVELGIVDEKKKLSKGNTPLTCQLQVSDQKKVYDLLKYMYSDSIEETRLDRKYELYQEMLKNKEMFYNFKKNIDYRL